MNQFSNSTPTKVLDDVIHKLETKFNRLRWWQKMMLGSLYSYVMNLLKDAREFIIFHKEG